ncbi:YhdP family protein [Nitrincola alkalilacustris]|uniref:YhdP family protein n=1 Tax=Nitrincola alkalilacustris TaxID=1571224 RepID=UPI00124EA85E|nr:YhdP family protein [Nitrincola alkalilacustris]
MRQVASRLLWLLLILGLLIALLLVVVRIALPQADIYKDVLAQKVSDHLGMSVTIGAIAGELEGLNPGFTLTDISIDSLSPEQAQISLIVSELDLKLDFWRSIKSRAPVFEFLNLSETDLRWQEKHGRWLPDGEASEEESLQPLLRFLLQQPSITVENLHIGLQPEQGNLQLISPVNARFESTEHEFQVSGSMHMPLLGSNNQIRFALQGGDVPLSDPLQGDLSFYVSTDALGPELLQLFPLPVTVNELSLQTEIWGDWRHGRLSHLLGNITLDRLELDLVDMPGIQKAGMQIALIPSGSEHQLQIKDLVLHSGGAAFNLPLLVADIGLHEESPALHHIGIPMLDLGAVHHWLQFQPFLPPFLDDLLLTLAPEGILRNIRLDWDDPADLMSLKLDADLENLGLSAWDEAPAVSGINGRLKATLTEGEIYLRSDDFTLYFPELYPEGWRYDSAGGVVNWRIDEEGVKVGSGLLRLADEYVSGAGRFSMVVPFDNQEQTELTLMIGMTGSDALQTERYTPLQEVGEELHAWLAESIMGGHLNQGGLLIHGGTRRSASPSPMTVQLFFDIDQAEFSYQPGWPAVEEGDLFMQLYNDTMRIDIRSGRIRDTKIHSGWVYLPSGSDRVHIAAQLEGPAGDLEYFLKQTPLRDEIGNPLDEWSLSGELQTQLNLQIPLNGRDNPEIDAVSQVTSGRLVSEQQRLDLSELKGELTYSTQRGLHAEGLEGRLFGERIRGSIDTEGDQLGISLTGRIDPARMREWTDVSLLQLMTGVTDYHARLLVCPQQPDCSRLSINTLLQGVAVDLPAPYGKPSDTERLLELSILLDRDELMFSYSDQLHGVFDLQMPLRGHVHLGTDGVTLPAGPGIVVDGQIEYLSEPVIRSFLSSFTDAADVEASHAVLSRLALKIGRFEARGVSIDDLVLVLRPALGGGWQLQLAAPNMTGQLSIPEHDGQLWRLDLAHFALVEGMLSGKEEGVQPVTPLSPADIPALDIHVADLIIGQKPMGEWRLSLRPERDRVAVRGIEGDLQQVQVRGEATWHTGSRSNTGLTLRIEGADIGDVLERWGYGRAIETERINSDIQLDWSGAPWDFELARLSGEVTLNAVNGRLIESGNSANFLRVFGILNLNTLSRRLRLDFSDLLKRGVVFDQLTADYRLEQGIAHTRAPLQLTGPSAVMGLEGSLDLINETVDKSIEVLLPVSSNLTIGAALLGAPHVAGALFIIDRITGGSLEKLTAIRYTLTGDWGDPQIQLITQEVDHAIGG